MLLLLKISDTCGINNWYILSCMSLWYTCEVKVLDQITLENKFCLNFKIRSVFMYISSKVKKLQICIKWRLGYLLLYWVWLPHFINYLTCFWLFLQFWNPKFQDANEKNMKQKFIGTKISKRWGRKSNLVKHLKFGLLVIGKNTPEWQKVGKRSDHTIFKDFSTEIRS